MTEERKKMIDEKVARDKQEGKNKEQKIKEETQQCLQIITGLTPRIKDLLEFAWYAIDNGIKLGDEGLRQTYDAGFFMSNSWSHLVGIKSRKFLGITKGGAFGDEDFYTNGSETFNIGKDGRIEPLLNDMKRFIESFDELETKLYAYVEKKCERS